jgi:hypothetical protein
MPTSSDDINLRLKRLAEYLNDEEILSLARDILSQDYSAQLEEFFNLEFYHRGRYYHENYMQCDYLNTEEMTSFRSLAKKFYSMLGAQYEYLQSDEAVIETIKCNDMEFLVSEEILSLEIKQGE